MCIFSAFTDECIFKYDHYCPWTNNALGGLNHRYFLAFLISLTVMIVNADWMAFKALDYVTKSMRLWEAQYLDDQGMAYPMNIQMVVQVRFLEIDKLLI